MTHRPIRPSIRAGGEDVASAEEASRDRLREAFSFWASGVTVVAVDAGEGAQGMTVSAFAPLSLSPPLVLVCLDGDAPLLVRLRERRRFTVNLLGSGQRAVATRFADRFPVGRQPFREGGEAEIEGALASLVCALESDLEGGDHRVVIGRVLQAVVGADAAPLLHYRREYRTLG